MLNAIEDSLFKLKDVPNFDTVVRLQVYYTAEVVTGTAYIHVESSQNNSSTFFFKDMSYRLPSNFIEWTQAVKYTNYILHNTIKYFGCLNFTKVIYISFFKFYLQPKCCYVEEFETFNCNVQNIVCVFDCLHSNHFVFISKHLILSSGKVAISDLCIICNKNVGHTCGPKL
jgi:hypothetical protein